MTLVITRDAGHYARCWSLHMLPVITNDAGHYGRCWSIRMMLVITRDAGHYAWYWSLRVMPVITHDVGYYAWCWSLRMMLGWLPKLRIFLSLRTKKYVLRKYALILALSKLSCARLIWVVTIKPRCTSANQKLANMLCLRHVPSLSCNATLLLPVS
jgi:hypothetical protein